jgi:hypothetical protein
MDQEAVQIALMYIKDAIEVLQMNKPEERGEDARRCAIVITELEKVQAITKQFLASNHE